MSRDWIAAAVRGGVDLIQLRDKTLSDDELVEAARAFVGHDALFILNDRPDLVDACGADGIHVGQDDDPPKVARAAVRPDRRPGRGGRGVVLVDACGAATSPSSSSVLSRSWIRSTPPRIAASIHSRGRAGQTRYRRAVARRSRGVMHQGIPCSAEHGSPLPG